MKRRRGWWKWKHGEGGNEWQSPEYNAWRSMRQRCRYRKGPGWKNYGGRGITFDPRWNDFKKFLRDVGRRPSSRHTLERIDNGKGYFPKNVRWATRKEQAQNRRTTKLVSANGVTATTTEWAKKTGLPVWLIRNRIYYGWPHEKAVGTPWRRRPGMHRHRYPVPKAP